MKFSASFLFLFADSGEIYVIHHADNFLCVLIF